MKWSDGAGERQQRARGSRIENLLIHTATAWRRNDGSWAARWLAVGCFNLRLGDFCRRARFPQLSLLDQLELVFELAQHHAIVDDYDAHERQEDQDDHDR